MNDEGRASVLNTSGTSYVGLDCSPHPLDVLAIYALYQQESSP